MTEINRQPLVHRVPMMTGYIITALSGNGKVETNSIYQPDGSGLVVHTETTRTKLKSKPSKTKTNIR